MMTGTVTFYDGRKGEGRITPDKGGDDLSINIMAVDRAGLAGLTVGQVLEYEVETDHFGRHHAIALKLVAQAS